MLEQTSHDLAAEVDGQLLLMLTKLSLAWKRTDTHAEEAEHLFDVLLVNQVVRKRVASEHTSDRLHDEGSSDRLDRFIPNRLLMTGCCPLPNQ